MTRPVAWTPCQVMRHTHRCYGRLDRSGPARLSVGWTVTLLEVVALGVALAVALRLRLQNLDAYTGSFDEGIRSEQLLLMSAGYRPFRDIFASQGPLLLDLLYPFFAAFGQTLAAARIGVVVCSVVALLGAWWIARQSTGPLGGFAAIVVLGLSPGIPGGLAPRPGRSPHHRAVTLRHRRGTGLRSGDGSSLPGLSAACCALALLIKPMALHVGAPILVLLVAVARPAPGPEDPGGACRREDLAAVRRYVGVRSASCVVAALGPAQVWDNLGAYRAGAGRQFGAVWSANLRLAANVMARITRACTSWRRPGWLLGALAAPGAHAGASRLGGAPSSASSPSTATSPTSTSSTSCRRWRCSRRWGRPGWRGGPGCRPFARSRQLARPDGIWRTRCPSRLPSRHGWSDLGLFIGPRGLLGFLPAVYGVPIVFLIREAPKIAAERRGRAVDLEIAEIIRSRTPPDSWVLADNPGAAFDARRLVIPYLVDTSGTRIKPAR